AFGPREPGVAALAWSRDRSEHVSAVRVDLLDAILGNLEQVPAIERRSCMRADIYGSQRLAGFRIQRIELVSGSNPQVLAVIRNSVHAVGIREGSVLTDDFGC